MPGTVRAAVIAAVAAAAALLCLAAAPAARAAETGANPAAVRTAELPSGIGWD